MSEAGKDTIYIDVDDEITSIIDKVQASDKKIVALVLPKRATVLQSIVNMKLLKRAATTHKKNLVLITSEAALLPLAGAVKLHVAKTLQSKPAIPPGPEMAEEDVAVTPEEVDDAEVTDEPTLSKDKSVGELAGLATRPADAEETIDVDGPEEPAAEAAEPAKKAPKGNKKLKVPNFEKFRTKLLLIGGGLILLLILLYMGLFVLPKAKVVIKTDNLSVTAGLDFTADTGAESVDKDQNIVPATSKDVKKTDTDKAPATGKKNVGEKATGTVTLQNCTKTDGTVTIPAGTPVSNNGNVFLVDEDEVLPASILSGGGSKCFTPSKTVSVTAQSPGDQYNLSGGRVFAVSGFGSVNGTDSSAMTGGTTKEVTVVSQSDIDTLKTKLADKSKDAARDDLKKAFQDDNLFPLAETFANGDPSVTASPTVGSESSDVSVTTVTTYTMLGVKRDDLRGLVEEVAKQQIDTSKQAISSDGLDSAVFRLVDKGNGQQQKLSVQTQVETGTHIDEDDLKKQIAGKKKGDARDLIAKYPGVKDVTIDLSPFWVSKVPGKAKRVTIQFDRPQSTNQSDDKSSQ
jgi:hypothetical protein